MISVVCYGNVSCWPIKSCLPCRQSGDTVSRSRKCSPRIPFKDSHKGFIVCIRTEQTGLFCLCRAAEAVNIGSLVILVAWAAHLSLLAHHLLSSLSSSPPLLSSPFLPLNQVAFCSPAAVLITCFSTTALLLPVLLSGNERLFFFFFWIDLVIRGQILEDCGYLSLYPNFSSMETDRAVSRGLSVRGSPDPCFNTDFQ